MSMDPLFHINVPFNHIRLESSSSNDSLPSVEEETSAFLEQADEIAFDLNELRHRVPPQLRFFATRPDVIIPQKRSVGWDLFTLPQFNYTIPVGQSRLIPLGVAFGFPEGYYGQLFSKSGLAFQDGIYVQGGVIDPDYNGDINVLLHNFGTRPFHLRPAICVCQMILLRYQYTITDLVPVSNIKQLRNSLLVSHRSSIGLGSRQ